MAAAKLKAAELSAAHARAEADEASFQEREKIALEKRRAENQNRRALEGEREKNRIRKLGAQTGREWDAEKKEEDYSQRNTRGSAFRRGVHGGVAYDRRGGGAGPPPHSAFSGENEPEHLDGYQHRGRGGRGRGRGGGRGGRGGSFADNNQKNSNNKTSNGTQPRNNTSTPSINAENEFPSLPAGKPTTSAPAPGTSKISTGPVTSNKDSSLTFSPMTPSTPQGSWAEQVESSQADNSPQPPPSQPQT